MRESIKRYLIMLGIIYLVSLLWQTLELVIYGEVTPRRVDNIIGIILAISLYNNFKNWMEK